MSSLTTAIPTGTIRGFEWCYQPLFDIFSDDYENPDFSTCANSTRGTVDSDFETFCCDGQVIGFYTDGLRIKSGFTFEDLQCCRIQEPQQGGIGPIPEDNGKTCTATATPTPLASLAATNTANAQPYLVTYMSAKQEGSTLTDWIVRETPYCFWVDTKHGVATTTVTVEAAAITTLPPDTTDRFGNTIDPSTRQDTSSGSTVTESSDDAESTGSSTSRSGSTGSSSDGTQSSSRTAAATANPTSAATSLNVPTAMFLVLLLGSWFSSMY